MGNEVGNKTTRTRPAYILLILILGGLTALSPFSIDMYLPGFPAIAKDLSTSAAKVSLSLSSFFIGISLGQLIYGPLLDRFGRKIPLYIGLSVYILASLGCAFTQSIGALIGLRVIQALGSCAATVASVTLVRDLFPVEENAKVFALLILVLGASPMIAPTAGGYIISAWGWHAVFLVLTAICVSLFISCILWLPAGNPPDLERSLKPGPITKSFWEVFINPTFYTYCLAGSLAFMGLFAYVAGSPVVFMSVFGVSQKTYGWIFAILSIGFISASQLNNILLKRFRSQQILQFYFELLCGGRDAVFSFFPDGLAESSGHDGLFVSLTRLRGDRQSKHGGADAGAFRKKCRHGFGADGCPSVGIRIIDLGIHQSL